MSAQVAGAVGAVLPDPLALGLSEAWRAVREVLDPTPLLWAPELSERAERPVWLKLESLQVTGSFKVRGALARMSALSGEERQRGVVTCSSGNHGRAVAWAAERLGIPAVICLPGWVDPVKRAAIESHGAEARLVGSSYDEAEREAHRVSEGSGRTLIHPFDDPLVVAGQGTVALELVERCPGLEAVYVPLSGGGLAGGVAYALAQIAPGVEVTAVSARNARVMRASLEAGHPVELPEEPTLASALAGGIGLENRVTFDLVRTFIHRHLEVDEKSIAAAMAYAFRSLGLVIEGGGTTALAALRGIGDPRPRPQTTAGPIAVVLSGGNVDLPVLTRVLDEPRRITP